jgi:hypothetical protein
MLITSEDMEKELAEITKQPLVARVLASPDNDWATGTADDGSEDEEHACFIPFAGKLPTSSDDAAGAEEGLEMVLKYMFSDVVG